MLSASGGAAKQAGEGTNSLPIPMQNYDSYFYEHCRLLKKGQTLNYHFTSKYPVAFNIHHHQNDDTLYLDNLEEQTVGTSNHTIQVTGEYCFMWENRKPQDAAFTIDFQYTLRSMPEQ